MTDAEFLAWLEDGYARRVVLVEVGVLTGSVETTRLLADRAYTSEAGVPYEPLIRGGVSFSESLSLDGGFSMSTGAIEVDNASGERDAWLDDVWKNRPVQVFLGDVDWPRAQFRPIFTGTVADISARDSGALSLSLRDKLQRLNTAVSEATVGGTGANAQALQPLAFGEVFNVSPVLANPSTHEYQVHAGQVERIIEVRDNGVPVSFTPVLSTGRFRLTASPVGQITASVQGDAAGGYRNTVSTLVQRLATAYGAAADRFTAADLDTAQLATFNAAHPQPVGMWLPDRANVLAVCQQLASSVGAQVAMSRGGLLRLLKVALPAATGAARTVTSADMRQGTFKPSRRTDVLAGVRLGYVRNWTMQTSLETGIPAAHREMYETEYQDATATDSAVAARYRLQGEPDRVPTLLLRAADAQAEASRRLALWRVPRTVYELTGGPSLMLLELGQPLSIAHHRFGFAGGRAGVIVGLKTDWSKRTVAVEVLV